VLVVRGVTPDNSVTVVGTHGSGADEVAFVGVTLTVVIGVEAARSLGG